MMCQPLIKYLHLKEFKLNQKRMYKANIMYWQDVLQNREEVLVFLIID